MPGQLNIIHMLGLLIGGLSLFLFGLELMTAGLKSIAGSSLQEVLGKLTANRFRGILAGAFVTAMLNSSTITTVLLVGFVSASLMTLEQCVPMIMGANIGSTFTAQLMAFNLSALTPFMLGIGFLLHSFAGGKRLRRIGGVILGFGLLFLGIEFMGDATRPLRTFQPFIDAMQTMENPFLGILAGAVFTAVVQSSAATLAIVIALASQGLIPLEAGITLILGANIGTCGTALLASIGKSAAAVQVGVVHLLFNVIGVLFFVFFIPQLADVVRLVSPVAPNLEGAARLAAETPRQVANTHTLFSLASTFILIWFAGPLARLARLIVPSRPTEIERPGQPVYLDESSLTAPSLALERMRLELARAGDMVVELVRRGPTAAVDGRPEEINAILQQSGEIDHLTGAMLVYLGRVSQVPHSEAEGDAMLELMEIVSNLESISEIVSTNFVALGQQRITDGIELANLRDDRTGRLCSAVAGNLAAAVHAIRRPYPGIAAAVAVGKSEIEAMGAAARQSVLDRLQITNKADVLRFRLANDMIEQFKQIARFTSRIAETARQWSDAAPTMPLPHDAPASV